MIKINGYWYSYGEVKEALEKKGYYIVTLEVSSEKRDYPKYETYALKDGKEPSPLNTMQSVALREFHKKPALV